MTRPTLLRGLALILLLALGACAPLVQHAGLPDAAFQGPRLEPREFVSFDGAHLGLQRWDAAGEPWAVIIGLHGMNGYSEAFHLPGPYWAAHGVTTLAYDQRGFGRSARRGVWGGRELMDEDLRTFAALTRLRYPHAIIAVAGVSMGGAVAIDTFASGQQPSADRLVLLSPAVWGWSTEPVPYRIVLWLAAHTIRGVVINPPQALVEHIRATDNIDELRRMGSDPLMIWGARPDALFGLVGSMQRSWRETADLKVPTFYLYGARDQIIPKRPAFQAANRLKPPGRTAYYAEGYHLLLSDRENPKVWDDVLAFIRDPAAALPSGAPAIPLPTKANLAAANISGH